MTCPGECPFCGSHDTGLGSTFGAVGVSHYVLCRRCGAEGPHTGAAAQTEQAAIEAWNGRPLPFDKLKAAIQADRAYAWSWHCNVAMPMVDGGLDADTANESAACVMQHLWGVDVRSFPEWEGRRRGHSG